MCAFFPKTFADLHDHHYQASAELDDEVRSRETSKNDKIEKKKAKNCILKHGLLRRFKKKVLILWSINLKTAQNEINVHK